MRVRTLYRNGHVYAPTRGFPTAMLVDGTRVLWVGGEAEADAQVDNAESVVDLGGRLVTTPFVDPAVFADFAGQELTSVSVEDATSVQSALDLLADAARADRCPMLAHGYDETRWPELRPPTPEEIARATDGRAVLLRREGSASAVVSPALRDACARQGLDVQGWDAVLGRDDSYDAQRVLLTLHTVAERSRLAEAVARQAAVLGIGAMHDIDVVAPVVPARSSAPARLPVVRRFLEHLCPPDEDPARVVAEHGVHGLCVRLDALSLPHRAAMSAPYIDQPGWTGPDTVGAEQLAEHYIATSLAGVQTTTVATGDRAAAVMVEAMRIAVRTAGLDRFRSLRHRALTASLGETRVLGTMVDLGVCVLRAPQSDARWGGSEGLLARRLGPTRAAEHVALASLGADGLELALTSAAPMSALDPWETIRAARWHRNEEERLSVGEAFRALTVGGWRAAGEDHRGHLDVGLPADFVVWEIDPEQLTEAHHDRLQTPGLPHLPPGSANPRALLTVVGGRIIHSSEGALT